MNLIKNQQFSPSPRATTPPGKSTTPNSAATKSCSCNFLPYRRHRYRYHRYRFRHLRLSHGYRYLTFHVVPSRVLPRVLGWPVLLRLRFCLREQNAVEQRIVHASPVFIFTIYRFAIVIVFSRSILILISRSFIFTDINVVIAFSTDIDIVNFLAIDSRYR